jgi:hypothetical protein
LFLLFSRRIGCLGSLVISGIATVLILALMGVVQI